MMLDQEKGALQNEEEGDDSLKQELLKALEKADSVPEHEFDSEEVIDILNMLGKIERKEARKKRDNSPNEEMVSPEERTAAFIERFNEKKGTKFVKTMEELNARQEKAKKNLNRVIMVCILVFLSLGVANQVTMASANQSIFEFLGIKANKIIFQLNANEVRSDVDVKEDFIVSNKTQNFELHSVINELTFDLYLPQYTPDGLILDELKCNQTDMYSVELYPTYINPNTDEYLLISIYQNEFNVGNINFFIGEQWEKEEVQLKTGKKILLYLGEDIIKTLFKIDEILYVFDSNLSKTELINIINSMEVINEKN